MSHRNLLIYSDLRRVATCAPCSCYFLEYKKKKGEGAKSEKKKSLYKSGWDMSHMAQLPRNLLRERDLRLRHVAIGAGRNMAHMARNLSQRGRAVPPVAGVVFPLATYCTPSPDFRERWQRGGEGFSRAKGADTMLPVCPIPPLGPPHTPTPTDLPDWPPTCPPDWPPKGTGLPLPTGLLRPFTDWRASPATQLPRLPPPHRLTGHSYPTSPGLPSVPTTHTYRLDGQRVGDWPPLAKGWG